MAISPSEPDRQTQVAVDSSDPAALSRRERLTIAFVGCFLVIQLAIPAINLWRAGPVRFGWQMYAFVLEAPELWMMTANGDRRAIDPIDYFGIMRSEVDFLATLGPYLCRQHSETISVHYRRAHLGQVEEYQCASLQSDQP